MTRRRPTIELDGADARGYRLRALDVTQTLPLIQQSLCPDHVGRFWRPAAYVCIRWLPDETTGPDH